MCNNEKKWVFLSHSNNDYEKVRLVRNILEEQGFRPLMFFLNCLKDDDEIDSLIKREIDSRKRFILCDSKNAQNSKWVQEEVLYIKEKKRLWEKVNIDSSIEEIRGALCRFKSRNTIYINSAPDDRELVEAIKLCLQEKGLVVICKEKYNDSIDTISNGYLINIYSSNILISGNTPRFVMNYNEFLSINRLNDDTAIINVYIDPREQLLKEYWNDPGVNKYEGFVWPKNAVVDKDLSYAQKDSIPNLICNLFDDIDYSLNEMYDYAKMCKHNEDEVQILTKCMKIENITLDVLDLKKYGFSFNNYNKYKRCTAVSIVQSTAMFELACNHLLGFSCEKSFMTAVDLFYESSMLGMVNAQKILCGLDPSLFPQGLIKRIRDKAYTSDNGFPEYLLAKSIENGKILDEHLDIISLYEYSSLKGFWFGRREYCTNSSDKGKKKNAELKRMRETYWYEFQMFTYPSMILWKQLYEDIKEAFCPPPHP